MNYVEIAERKCFRHYKNGKLYFLVSAKTRDASNENPKLDNLVVYSDLDGEVFVRPGFEFFEKVDQDPADPYRVERFTPLPREVALFMIVEYLNAKVAKESEEQ